MVWWLFGLGFDIKIKVESDWQVLQAYSISFFVICHPCCLYDCGTFSLELKIPYHLKMSGNMFFHVF